MKERIIQIMQKMGVSKSEFADKIGVSVSLLSHVISGRNQPTLNVILGIHNAFPQVNIDWLFYGVGEMFPSANSKNLEISNKSQMLFDFSTEKEIKTEKEQVEDSINEVVTNIEKPTPKITEIRIFFDNGTYEVFKSAK